MPRYSAARLKIWGALLLSASLVSCSSSPATEPIPISSEGLPVIFSPTPSPVSKPYEESTEQAKDIPSDSPLPTSTIIDAQPSDDPIPAVEVSNIQPESTANDQPADLAFQPKSPSLAGIKLGASDKEVVKKHGLPEETYLLPGDNQSVNIWEYNGLSIGLDEQDKVVYVEVTSPDVLTGIQGLKSGMNGSAAGELLGIPSDDQTNVLTLEVSGGWFKLDLDPDNRQVLSLKLLSREI
jgi:hypothetical protein